MALRTFRSAAGVVWHVWSVIPGVRHDEERRRGYDRRSPDPVLAYTGPDRRTSADRRSTSRLFGPDMAAGWLAFECPTERRRLVPIPAGWDALSDAELERLCERAQPSPGVRPPRGPGPA
ncbi:MAG TPA: hypothetical protein VF746_24795 [Longimicrobium sp.]|jgi:hypothetical protein